MVFAYSHFATPNVANVSTDRVFKLKPGPNPKDHAGKVRKGIFNTETKLHAIQDAGLWYLKYEDQSAIPEKLNQRFTNFNMLLKYLTNYFELRGIEIEEVIS